MAVDPRDEMIRRVVAGKSFVDVGGLWGTVNEKVSVARAAGAANVTLMDIMPEGHPLWRAFDARMKELGIAGYGRIPSSDINALDPEAVGGRFDVVHCSGILYHCPDPIRTIRRLAELAGEHLILTSMVVPQTIESSAGRIELARGGALLIPALGPEEYAICSAYWAERQVAGVVGLEPGRPLDRWEPDDYGPWWWLYPPTTMDKMVEAAGLRVVDSCTFWEGRCHTVLATISPDRGEGT